MPRAIAPNHAGDRQPTRDDAGARAYVGVLVRERIRDAVEPGELIQLVAQMATATGLSVAREVVVDAVTAAERQRPMDYEPSRWETRGKIEGGPCDGCRPDPDDTTPRWLSWPTALTENETIGARSDNSRVGSALDLIEQQGDTHNKPDEPFHETDARLQALGLAGARDCSVTCVLPGHRGHSAQVSQVPAGHFDYKCLALSRPLGLAEVRAAQGHGAVRRLTPAHAHIWRLRLDFEAGLVRPPEVGLVLQERLPDSAITLCDGILLYVRLTLLSDEWPEEFALTRSFLVGWCGLTDEQVKRGRRLAERHGVIVKVGTNDRGMPQPRRGRRRGGAEIGCGHEMRTDHLPAARAARGAATENWRSGPCLPQQLGKAIWPRSGAGSSRSSVAGKR